MSIFAIFCLTVQFSILQLYQNLNMTRQYADVFPASIKDFLLRMLPQKSLHILRLLGLHGSIHQDFHDKKYHLQKLLRRHNESSKKTISAFNNFKASYPLLPMEIAPADVWPNEGPSISVKTHLKSTFSHAADLLSSTGRTLNSDDEKHLRFLLTHQCGWSATYPEHMIDSWVEYFRICHPNLNLVPILDSMTYVEELALLPEGMRPIRPQFFLLANEDSYFVYDATDGEETLFHAGRTLEEVYTGMRDWRWAEVSDNMWEVVRDQKYVLSSSYFPVYFREEDGTISCSIENNDEKQWKD
jgi:hypothetical protein